MRTSFLPSITGVLLLTVVYLLVHQLWYAATPLGVNPVMDGEENLQIAERLYRGESFEKPFHSAAMYPYLLALLQKVDVFGLSFLALARVVNCLGVIATTWLAGNLAWQIWKRSYAVWITGLLIGCNPGIQFFAADPLDITLATTCLTAATWFLYRGYKARQFSWSSWLVGGLILGLGMGLLSHLILVCVFWPVLAALATMRNRRTRMLHFVLIAAGIGFTTTCVSFIAIGLLNKSVSGEFRMLPWGASFTLWSGNGPLNNGRFYQREAAEEELPTAAEFDTLYHYQQATGNQPPYEPGKVSSYFLKESFFEVFRNPGGWIRLMIRKSYALIHNYEQFDNKTYSLQKSISPFLSINPLGWGILLTFATLGGVILFYSKKSTFTGIIILIVLYSIMVLATHTANRYRVPLIPLLALLAGSIPKLYFRRDQFSRRGVITLAFSGVIVALVTFIPFIGIAAKDTYLFDYGMMAKAAYRHGFNEEAILYADLALSIDSTRADLREITALSRFDQWFHGSGTAPLSEVARWWLKELEQLNGSSPELSFAQAVFLWKLGDQTNACSLWRYASDKFGHTESINALIWNCDPDEAFLSSLSTQDWRRLRAIKLNQVGFSDDSGAPPLTGAELNSIAEKYRRAFEPFNSGSANR